jgi:hypothetical protein
MHSSMPQPLVLSGGAPMASSYVSQTEASASCVPTNRNEKLTNHATILQQRDSAQALQVHDAPKCFMQWRDGGLQ